jgi:hypothetical protein
MRRVSRPPTGQFRCKDRAEPSLRFHLSHSSTSPQPTSSIQQSSSARPYHPHTHRQVSHCIAHTPFSVSMGVYMVGVAHGVHCLCYPCSVCVCVCMCGIQPWPLPPLLHRLLPLALHLPSLSLALPIPTLLPTTLPPLPATRRSLPCSSHPPLPVTHLLRPHSASLAPLCPLLPVPSRCSAR